MLYASECSQKAYKMQSITILNLAIFATLAAVSLSTCQIYPLRPSSSTRTLSAGLTYLCLIGCLSLITIMTSCHKSVQSPDTGKTLDLPAGSPAVIAAGDQFALNFFSSLLQQDTASDNKLVSPFSIYMALSMVYNGSAGSTRDSMAGTLALAGISTAELNAVSAALIKQLPSEDSKVTLSIANSLWYQQNGPQPVPDFVDSMTEDYSGYIQALNFSSPASLTTINSWVATKTDNKITNLLSTLSPENIMVLINAIYFNGTWQYAFNPADTRDNTFYLSNGTTSSVPFMNQQANLWWYQDSAYTMLELPYGAGNSFDMYVVMPTNPQVSLRSFATAFNNSTFAAGLSLLDSQAINLYLPKWQTSFSIPDFLPELATLGMGIASGPGANFSAMFSTPVYISQAVHKTYIDVTETGTEAAAATAFTMFTTTAIGSKPEIPVVMVNHPYLYFIVEKQTGAILFEGTMNNPAQN
jgi:serpin B